MEWIAVWIFCGIVSAAIASGRGRSGCAWLLLGVLFGPFGFAVALMPRIENTRGLVKCPFCAERIKSEAVKCRFCGSLLQTGPPEIITPSAAAIEPPAKSTKTEKIIIAIVVTVMTAIVAALIISVAIK